MGRAARDNGPAVQVADEPALMTPGRRGDNRLDGLRDVVEDGRHALLVLVPGTNTTLRVIGRTRPIDDAGPRQGVARGTRHPATALVVEVAEVYPQCAKALMRSDPWTSGDPAQGLPTMGDFRADMSRVEIGGKDCDRTCPEAAKPRMW